jgi:hypothetical protein
MAQTPTRTPAATRTTTTDARFYDVTHADGTTSRYPSVTTILGAIAKPALVPWAAKEERLAVMEAAADLYAETEPLTKTMPRAWYLLALQQRLGTTKAHTKALTKAGDIGTAAHAKIEWSLRRALGQEAGPEPAIPAPAALAFRAFEAWRRAVRLEPLHVEQIVWSRDHAYAGTLDLVASLDTRALLHVLTQQGPVAPALTAWLQGRETATACVDFKTGKAIYGEAMLQSVAYQRAFKEMGHGRVDGGLIVRLPKLASDPGFEVAVVPPAFELLPTFLATRQLWEWTYAQEASYRARTARPRASRTAVA